MSANRTEIYGIKPVTNIEGGAASPYTRSHNVGAARTVIAGITVADAQPCECDTDNGRQTQLQLQDRQLAGVMLSLSRNNNGELFALYQGRNTVGSAADNDICLPEATVSPYHAIINVGTDDQYRIVVSVTNLNTDFGTKVNDADCHDSVVCRNRSILQFGLIYRLLMQVFDLKAEGLSVDVRFGKVELPSVDLHAQSAAATATAPSVPDEVYASTVSAGDEFNIYAPSISRANSAHYANNANMAPVKPTTSATQLAPKPLSKTE